MRPDQHLARAGRLLEPRRQRHGLAGRERRFALVDDDFARLDPDARIEAELVDRLEHRERGTDRALGIVLVCLRDAERGHDGVPGEFLDGAAVGLDAALDAVEEPRHTTAGDLRILARD